MTAAMAMLRGNVTTMPTVKIGLMLKHHRDNADGVAADVGQLA